MHFGILGQKWGVRRFQNPDGTLTPEGRERYGKVLDEARRDTKQNRDEFRNLAKYDKQTIKSLQEGHPQKAEEWLDNAFGPDWKNDPSYMKQLKQIWEFDDIYDFAKDEMQREVDYELNRYKSNYNDNKREADTFSKRYEQLKTKNLNNLSVKELDALEKYLDHKGPWPFK